MEGLRLSQSGVWGQALGGALAIMSDRLIRVFPRKTRATPPDGLAYFGAPDRLAEADEVHA
jgi:hypothetical protein